MRIAILGAGPAGLLAAHGLQQFGNADVFIFSKKRPSQLYGAQYLHDNIPGLSLPPPVQVKYELRGTAEEYAFKVYGPELSERPGFSVSPDDLPGDHMAWDIRSAYSLLWNNFEGAITDADITPRSFRSFFEGVNGAFDGIISSIPKPALCQKPEEHSFLSRKAWALGDAPDRGQRVSAPLQPDPENRVVCNSYLDSGWYRYSYIYGHRTMEWALNRRKPPISGIAEITKPIGNNCNCWPGVLHVGRYGKWEKGVLSHHAFNDALARFLG